MIQTFDKLGHFLREFKKFYAHSKYISQRFKMLFFDLRKIIQKITLKNSWFRVEDLLITIHQWGMILKEEKLESWIHQYSLNKNRKSKKVLVIMPGNIPMVGFHDFLCVLLSGHNIIIKLSEEDNLLIPFLCKIIIHIKPILKHNIKFTQNIFHEKFDSVIASGNNNTARYFEYYFRNYPILLRKRKTSIAVLQGNEKEKELIDLNKDILTYSGRGCRNVGKIFMPYNYNIHSILDKSFVSEYVTKNYKYIDNYKYCLSIYTMNKISIQKNHFLIFKEEKDYYSPISVVYYEFYDDLNQLKKIIMKNNQHIQCIVSKNFLKEEIIFGKTQYPELEDYADGIDTIQFLNQ
ncbi:phosphoserine transaminase [Blattabacterium sp. (Blattella germanica) str. Bge]|uniref:acyl-CoA reductase n=1 Tax=Blattabacterium sp. (Blattella germanica) TaxID=624186 RepID=UPI0001BB60E4|nr:acyl-CoA reductase [Blattabacterium sp. (Blattella germanica)]ACY40174.1 phosphoserine transaminase [Blattabacterium sp. (Blattella germanica) str. Bge]